MSAYMLLTGLPITASEALQSGLVGLNHNWFFLILIFDLLLTSDRQQSATLYWQICKMTATSDELENELTKICEAIVSKPKGVLALGKKFYYRQIELGIKQALLEGGEVMVNNLAYKDAQEGIAAFTEKRKPNWIHSDEKV